MTLATGSAAAPCRGFTLTELLIVIAIMMVLMGMVVAAAVTFKQKAFVGKAESMIQELQIAIDEFKNQNGTYPADGMDTPFETTDTVTALQSGAALTYQLSSPVRRPIQQPDGSTRFQLMDPVIEFKIEDLVQPDEDLEDVFELVDPWGNPLHYDRLVKGESDYSLQETEDCHFLELTAEEVHNEDPREAEGVAVEVAGPQNPRKYDVWIHGPGGHSVEYESKNVIGNWLKPGGE